MNIEERQAYEEMLEINKTYNYFSDLGNPDYLNWEKKLNNLKVALCNSKHWDLLMDSIDLVKLKKSKLWF